MSKIILVDCMSDAYKQDLKAFCLANEIECVSFNNPGLKSLNGDNYTNQIIETLSMSSAETLVILDSYWPEYYVHPMLYGRESILTADHIDVIHEVESHVEVQKFMVDTSEELVMTYLKKQLSPQQMHTLSKGYMRMRDSEDHEMISKEDLKEVISRSPAPAKPETKPAAAPVAAAPIKAAETEKKEATPFNEKILMANAINSLLAKDKVIKGAGYPYDILDGKVKAFLQEELAAIFNQKQAVSGQPFSSEQVDILKAFCSTLKKKQGGK